MEHAQATIQAVSYLRFIVLFPLLGVLFNIFAGPRLGRKAVNFVAPGVVLLSFLFSCAAFLQLSPGGALVDTVYPWITSGTFHVDFALRVDPLAAGSLQGAEQPIAPRIVASLSLGHSGILELLATLGSARSPSRGATICAACVTTPMG